MNETKTSVFSEFTNKYSLSKTLRFELKPAGRKVFDARVGKEITMTEKMILDNKVFEKDQTIDDSYHQAKFYFDMLHRRFIEAALAPEKAKRIPFQEFATFIQAQNLKLRAVKDKLTKAREEKSDLDPIWKELNALENEIKKEREDLYVSICGVLEAEATIWKDHYAKNSVGKNPEKGENKNEQGIGFLTSAGVLDILKHEFPEDREEEFLTNSWPSLFVEDKEFPDKKKYIFESFKRFSGYLTKFQETRKNIYANNGIATAVATRIVGNLEIFIANKRVFDGKYLSNYKEIGFDRPDVFEVENYHQYLLQNAIEALDGHESEQGSYNKIIGDFNFKIKMYRDQKVSDAKQNGKKFKNSKLPLFKKLEKQILGEIHKQEQLITANEKESKSEEEVLVQRFHEFIESNEKHFSWAKDLMTKFFSGEFESEYSGMYLRNTSVNTMAYRWFSDAYTFEKNLPQTSGDKKEVEVVKVKKFVTIDDIKMAVEKMEGKPFKDIYYEEKIIKEEDSNWDQFLSIWHHEFNGLFTDRKLPNKEMIRGYDSCLEQARKLESFSKERKPQEIAIIKDYADASMKFFQVMKYLALDERDLAACSNISTDFYAEVDKYVSGFEFNRYYNAFRNFITKKPFDENKIKLNFDKDTLLKGFSKQYNAYLFRKITNGQERFFLGITSKGELDEGVPLKNTSEYSYFPASQLKFQNLVNKAFEPRFGYVYSKEVDEVKAIQDAKEFIRERHLAKYPTLQSILERKFLSKKEFTDAINQACIEVYSKNSFVALDKSQVEEKNKNGDLYLFEIMNKDWSGNKKQDSNKNIHSLYFESLFDIRNLSSPVLKISGGSEVFCREASAKDNQCKQQIITSKGKNITEFLQDKFEVTRRPAERYRHKKYFLHLSTVLNYGSKKKAPSGEKNLKMFAGSYNKEIRQQLSLASSVNVIGLDRGEKHLVYYSVINQRGEIIEQGSLNVINGVNYYEKLVSREKERRENRQSWNPVAQIKDLKKGYVSQVVRTVADLAVKHNAIVVMEDLNMRFKQIRGGIERSVYQQLEKQLIDKFGYLIFKDRKPDEIGGVLHGYQLSAPFVSFKEIGKQTGIIFYTQADYTSVTDPVTGFRKNVYISNSAPIGKIQEAIKKFDEIGWDEDEQSYYFRYDPRNFTEEKFRKNTYCSNGGWTVYAKVPRIYRKKEASGYWKYDRIPLNDKFEELFKTWNFDSIKSGDMKSQILFKIEDGSLEGKREFDGKMRGFYHSFIHLFNMILQLRNSYSEQWIMKEEDGKMVAKRVGENIDFIASPVKPFFSSYACDSKGNVLSPKNLANLEQNIIGERKEEIKNEFNGDANGAYNIARKGIIILQKIAEKPEKSDLYISKFDWDKFSSEMYRDSQK